MYEVSPDVFVVYFLEKHLDTEWQGHADSSENGMDGYEYLGNHRRELPRVCNQSVPESCDLDTHLLDVGLKEMLV